MTRIFTALCIASALGAVGLAGCAPKASTGHTAQGDGVTFTYSLSPTSTPNHYRMAVALQDAHNGEAIDDAGVAVELYGPGIPGDDLINLRHDPVGGGSTYVGDVSLPQAATYRITFQANRRAPAGSAQATFSTPRPAG